MAYTFKILALSGVLFLIGCAHSTMRGTVAMKVSDREAHVCLGDNEVKAGDKVALFSSECKAGTGKQNADQAGCKKVKLGEGQVVRVLNEHYSLIEVNPGVLFNEGTIVEKQ
ncbi:hypothetical protein WDW86_07340 [Bdellovibrionota bacterium FG-2]